MSMKILPMQYPIITSWQWQANTFAILSNYPETTPWILSNYIQLQLTANENSSYVDFYRAPTFEFSPWLCNQFLKRETVQYFKKEICDFFIDSINLNNYIYAVFDQAHFLQGYESLPHDLFIYGFNEESEVFYVADFTFKEKYSFAEVSFSQIEKAYYGIKENDDWLYGGKGGLSLLSFNSKATYDFNIMLVIELFEEFLLGKNSYEKSREISHQSPPCVFGLEVYPKLAEDLIRVKNRWQEVDYRPFHVIYDHKILMLQRIKYLEQHGYLKEAPKIYDHYKQLEHNALMARNLLIKATLTQDFTIIDKVIAIMKVIETSEREAIKLLLKNIIRRKEFEV